MWKFSETWTTKSLTSCLDLRPVGSRLVVRNLISIPVWGCVFVCYVSGLSTAFTKIIESRLHTFVWGISLISGGMKSIIYFNTRDELIKVDVRKVAYFEADGNYVHIHFTNGIETMILTTLQNVTRLLAEYSSDSDVRFIRVGKRYILNVSVIYKINIPKQELILTDFINPNPQILHISKEALKQLKTLYRK